MSEHPSPPYNLPDTGEAAEAAEAGEAAEAVIEAAEAVIELRRLRLWRLLGNWVQMGLLNRPQIVDTAPTETTITRIGKKVYVTREEAEADMAVVCKG